ncbi:heat shock 70 kDa protein 12A-like isoform X1 [Ruditapes philippinarum]|uniref:heat shock 70 kDa protein 12A-like isoform X1 n=1 Tax=Ruditapes philippinarum TaxID=129788 RepID=UPI00295BFB04|nr:heat shock 70 kDa protein 12A-like isoform X1 [Ruditapes philippinarum]
MVNKAFEDFLKEIVGDTVFESFKMKETEDWLYMALQFESKKREIEIKSPRYITLRLPFSLIDLCEKVNGIQIQDAVAASKYAEIIEIVGDKLKLSKVFFFYMFGQTLQRTVDHVKSLFREKNIKEVGIILMIGGFSESRLLQQALKEAFPNKEIVVPLNPSSCVLRGALIYGHTPLTINSRILKYTYGTESNTKFKEGYLPDQKKMNSDAGIRCKDIFAIFVGKNTVVKAKDTYFKKQFTTLRKYQKAMSIRCFLSEKTNPRYVNEDGCLKIGKIRINLDNPDESLDRTVSVYMVFGDTEITVDAEDERTGNKTRAVIDFLG